MSEHSNNLIISKSALLQVFYASYWPVNAKKNCYVRRVEKKSIVIDILYFFFIECIGAFTFLNE